MTARHLLEQCPVAKVKPQSVRLTLPHMPLIVTPAVSALLVKAVTHHVIAVCSCISPVLGGSPVRRPPDLEFFRIFLFPTERPKSRWAGTWMSIIDVRWLPQPFFDMRIADMGH